MTSITGKRSFLARLRSWPALHGGPRLQPCASAVSGAGIDPDRSLRRRWRHRRHRAPAGQGPGGGHGQVRDGREQGRRRGLARLGRAGCSGTRRLHLGLPQRAEHVRRLSRSQGRPQGEPGQLHAADEPCARLQHLGRQGGQPLQGREGRHRGGQEGARADHGHRLRCRRRRSSRHPVDPGRDERQARHRSQPQHRRSQDPGARRRTCRCWAPT